MIRRADVRHGARDALVMNLGDLVREGAQTVDAARAEAERMLSAARAERDRLIADAREEGHRQGLERGLVEGRATGAEEGRREAFEEHGAAVAKLERAWSEALGRVEAARLELLAALRRDALALALGLAERVVKQSIACDAQAVLRQLEAALALLARPTRLVVAINPEDEALVREAMPGLMARFRDATQAEFRAEASIGRGGCVVRTDAGGVIDATIQTQVERLVRSMVGEVGSGHVSRLEGRIEETDAAETGTKAGASNATAPESSKRSAA